MKSAGGVGESRMAYITPCSVLGAVGSVLRVGSLPFPRSGGELVYEYLCESRAVI